MLIFCGSYADANVSVQMCELVNNVRREYGQPPLKHSDNMRYIAETHLDNLIHAGYDPFIENECDPHSWFVNTVLGIAECCYPAERCMGSKGRELTSYTGITIENIHVARASSFFTIQPTTSGITPESSVNGWVGSTHHLNALLGSQKVCGGAIQEYRTDVNPVKYHITGFAAVWLGNVNDTSEESTSTPTTTTSSTSTSTTTTSSTNTPTTTTTTSTTSTPTTTGTTSSTSTPTTPTTSTTTTGTTSSTSTPTTPTTSSTSTPTTTMSSTITPTVRNTESHTLLLVGVSIILAILLCTLGTCILYYYRTEDSQQQIKERGVSQFHPLAYEMMEISIKKYPPEKS